MNNNPVKNNHNLSSNRQNLVKTPSLFLSKSNSNSKDKLYIRLKIPSLN